MFTDEFELLEKVTICEDEWDNKFKSAVRKLKAHIQNPKNYLTMKITIELTEAQLKDVKDYLLETRNHELKQVANGTHKQFYFNKKTEKVMCKCGAHAVQIKEFYLCSSITAKKTCKY